jgi:hypothetical protein
MVGAFFSRKFTGISIRINYHLSNSPHNLPRNSHLSEKEKEIPESPTVKKPRWVRGFSLDIVVWREQILDITP